MFFALKKFFKKNRYIFFRRDKKINNKKKIIIFILRIPLYIPALFFFIIIQLIYILFKIKIRVGLLRADKLGHLSLENELYFCEKLKKNYKYNLDIFFNDSYISNKYLFNLIKLKINFLPNLFLRELYVLSSFYKNKKFIANRKLGAEDNENLVDKIPQQINISKDIIDESFQVLEKAGLKKKQKIVCIHIRDDFYSGDNSFNRHRNIYSISNYNKTILYLIKKKYFVVRVGKLHKIKFDIKSENFLDYPFSKFKSEKVDIFLAAKCDFCISTGSGFDALARMFRKPILYTNFSSYGDTAFGKKHMIIYKKLVNKKKKKLSINDLYKENFFQIDNSSEILNKKLFFIENSDIEILKATKDFINYKKNKIKFNKKYVLFDKKFKYFYIKNFKKKYNISINKSVNIAKLCPSFLNKII